jgi:hypothetical protein
VSLAVGFVISIGAIVVGILAFMSRDHAKPWFYWISPLLAIGFAGVMANLIAQYYLKVHRLETKGRPRK